MLTVAANLSSPTFNFNNKTTTTTTITTTNRINKTLLRFKPVTTASTAPNLEITPLITTTTTTTPSFRPTATTTTATRTKFTFNNSITRHQIPSSVEISNNNTVAVRSDRKIQSRINTSPVLPQNIQTKIQRSLITINPIATTTTKDFPSSKINFSILPRRNSDHRRTQSTSGKTSTKSRDSKSKQLAAKPRSSSAPVQRAANTTNSSTFNTPINNSSTSLAIQTSRNLFLHMTSRPTPTPASSVVDKDPDLTLLAKFIRPMLASSTWYRRSLLLQHFQAFLTTSSSRPDLPLDARVALFIARERQSCLPSTMARYAKEFRAMAHAIGMAEHPTLDMFIRGVAAQAASAPIKQAQLITTEQLILMTTRALLENNQALASSIYLCYKTCSRWGDIANLTKENFIINHQNLQDNEILVLWGTRLKTSRFRPFKATGLTIVREENHPQSLLDLKQLIRRLKSKEQRLCPKTTDQMLKWLKKDSRTSNLSCHSIKRTALDVLTTAVLEGRLAPTLLPLMAKHQDQNLQHFPESTIRYISNKVALAKIFNTQEATKLL